MLDLGPTGYLNNLLSNIVYRTIGLCIRLASAHTLNDKSDLVRTAKYNNSPTVDIYFV